MNGGAVARRVERLDVSMGRADGSLRTLSLARKWGVAAEVTALAAAQAVRPAARAIPELVASGRDGQGCWMITPFYTGRQAGTGAPPAVVFDSLACLHARFRAGRANLMGVPVVDHAWWQRLCLGWAAPLIERCGDRHPAALIRRAGLLLRSAADAPAAAAALGRLNVTLLHGDVHPGNIIAGDREAHLIDWGSARIGPPMLDLANVTEPGSAGFAAYRTDWEQQAGDPLDPVQVDLGYHWAAVQIPLQYLPWTALHRPGDELAAAAGRAEAALAALTELGQAGPAQLS